MARAYPGRGGVVSAAAPTGSYWTQIAAIRAQSHRPIVRLRAATVAVAEPLVAAIIALLLCGAVSGRVLLLDLAFGLALAVVLLVVVVLLASVYTSLLHSWRRVDGH